MLPDILVVVALVLAVIGVVVIVYGVWLAVKPWWAWGNGSSDFDGREM